MSERIDTVLVLKALAMALLHRSPPANLLFHSDRGVQYASGDYRQALARARLIASMSAQAIVTTTPPWKASGAPLSWNWLPPLFRHPCQARTQIFDYIETFYNRQRSHSALGYHSPVDFELLNN